MPNFPDRRYYSNLVKMFARSAAILGISERAGKSSAEAHQVDAAGQAILSLLQKASSIPESNKQRATEMAINQLRVAEDGLHPCNPRLSERSEGVEKWLLRICEEIEHQFFPKPQDKRMGL